VVSQTGSSGIGGQIPSIPAPVVEAFAGVGAADASRPTVAAITTNLRNTLIPPRGMLGTK
jgi:hypothetical protein